MISLSEKWWWGWERWCASHPLPWLWTKFANNIRVCGKRQKKAPISATLSPSPVLSRAGTISDQLRNHSCQQLILTQFRGKMKVFSLMPQGTLRRWVSERNPAPCWCASSLTYSEARLQEGRYWLLLPRGNTGDRLKRRGKKSFHS